VLVARHRALLEPVLPRFSRLAGWCLGAVTVTGLLTAVIRLETWDALLGTRYGVLVIAKAACLVLLGLLGGIARRRLAAGRTPVLRWAGVEVAVMAATLGIAAALSQSA
jgi:putative copper resistance protein D